MMKVCRLCLFEGTEEEVCSIWESEDLPSKVNECVSVNITQDDNISSNICASCIHYVTQWEIFRNMCHKSTEVLIKATIKEIEEISTKVEDIEIERPPLDTAVVSKDKSDSDSEEEYFESEFIKFSFKDDLIITENVYQCHICLIEFDNCFQYLDHQITHNGEPVFQCDKCTDVYSTRDQLVEHDKNHRTPCPHCGKLILKSSMNLHLVKHSDRFRYAFAKTNEGKVCSIGHQCNRCAQCGGRFNSNAALSQHTITVHTDIKDHICEVCGKRFSSQTAMRVHMKSHSEERRYPCKLCDYAGRTASAIYVHMSTHANDMCVCEVCSKTFKSNRNLNDHLRRVHTKEKKHSCSYCDKKFVDRYMLSVHIRCHTGVRPYLCSFCKKSFIRSDGLKEHIAIHGQRIMHDCKLCGKKFTSKRGLTRHSCISVA